MATVQSIEFTVASKCAWLFESWNIHKVTLAWYPVEWCMTIQCVQYDGGSVCVYPVNVQLFWHDTACFPPNSKQVCFYLFISVITEKMMISLHNCPEGLTRNVCLFENQDRPLPGKSFPCPKSSKYLTLSTYLETLMVSVEMDYFAES